MSVSEVTVPAVNPLRDQVESARAQAREQLTAAWQLHVARVEEQLRSGWGQHLEQLIEERFGELAAGIEAAAEERVRAEVDRAEERAKHTAARRLSERLNQFSRRLRQAGTQQEWSTALLDAAAEFCPRAAVFTLQGSALRLERSGAGMVPVEIPVQDAPAFAGAAGSLDPVVAAATAGELSEVLLAALGVPVGPRAYIFPIVSRNKAVAALYAEGDRDSVDANALELLATMAGTVWESRSQAANGLIAIEGAAGSWSQLPADEQDRHLRAQRFARVQVAEMRLYKSGEVKRGRTERALYDVLREDIDRARTTFAEQFLHDCPSMVDYLHLELIRTLANDDPTLLGTDYPGPLV